MAFSGTLLVVQIGADSCLVENSMA
jgi:hypothetical protein